MAWIFPRRDAAAAQQRLEGVLAERALAAEDLSQATTDAAAEAERNAREAARIAEDARARIARQELRRAARERAVLERGVASAVDDLLRLPSFGGPGDREA